MVTGFWLPCRLGNLDLLLPKSLALSVNMCFCLSTSSAMPSIQSDNFIFICLLLYIIGFPVV